MAWTYLAELVGLASLSKDGLDHSHIVKSIDTVRACFCPECNVATLALLPYGTMCELSKKNCYQRSTSLSADFPVRISALQEMEQVWKEADLAYSSKSFDSLAIFDQDSFSWKTSQLSLFGGLTEFSWSSLRWGTIVDGRLYQPQRWEPRISENGGSFLPTPTASEGGYNRSASENASIRPSLSMMARKNMWPTPRANDAEKRGAFDVMNPRNGLAAAVKRWPTPMARDWKGRGGKNRKSMDLPKAVGGNLSPMWVEWLMGYKIGWTALEDWAMQWFRCKPKKHLKG